MTEPTASTSPWSEWRPSAGEPWDLRRAQHLHRRAGFAAMWDELQRNLKDGPRAAIDRLLKGKSCTSGVPADFDALSRLIGDAAVAAGNANRLKAWWLYQMIFSPDPLRERLALLWHNHFATSNLKVESTAAMRRQNELLRKFGRARFAQLLPSVVKDPAILVWLDAAANRKEHPNENLARELMELFTLGEGNFSEGDVRDAARALTGWTVKDDAFRDRPAEHDEGEKTILGRRGRWRGDDLLGILLEHPATPQRLAARLCGEFFGEVAAADKAAHDKAVGLLADGLGERELDIGWAVETVIRSEAFFAERNIGTRVRCPVGFVVGSLRALELVDPPPSTLVLSEWTARLGQDLFYPPSVFGWSGGRSWLTTRTMIGRANYGAVLVAGSLRNPSVPLDALALADQHGAAATLETLAEFFSSLLLGDPRPVDAVKAALKGLDTKHKPTSAVANRLVAALLASPEYQLA